MPRKQPRIPKLSLHKASGQALVRINGRSIYLGRFGTPEAEERYNRIIAEWLTSGCRIPSTRGGNGDSQLSFAELILAYWRYRSTRYVDSTGNLKKELFHIKAAMRPVRRLYGSTSAAEFGPRKLITLQREYVESGYCRTMVNDYIRRVRRMFKWAMANEIVPAGVLHGLAAVDGLRAGESKAPEPRDVKLVPQMFVDAVIPHVGRQVSAMIRLQLLLIGHNILHRLRICGILHVCEARMHVVFRRMRRRRCGFGSSRQSAMG